jgi:hypothetical protein
MAGAKKKGPVRKRKGMRSGGVTTKKMRTGGMMPMKKMKGGGRPGAKKKGPVSRRGR